MAERVTRTIYINGKEVEYSLKSVNSQLARLRNELKGAEVDSQEFVDKLAEIRRVEKIYANHANALKPVKSGMAAIVESAGQFATAAGIAFSVGSVISFGREVLTVANNYEQTRISFEAMLQSKEKAQKLQADLFELVAKSPFEMQQAQQATKQLLAFGFSAAEVIPTLKSLGDIAAGVGQDKLPQIILAFGQVRAKTRLMGDELKQFTEAGIPLIEELAKVFKKPQAEIQKMVSDGKVGFADVQKALGKLTSEGGRFADLMQKQSQSLQGVWSTFKDTFTQNVLLPIGEGLSQYVKPAMQGLTESMEDIFPATQKASQGVALLQAQFNVEIDTLKRSNLTQDARRELIAKINKEYGQYLPSLLTEKSSINEITAAQNAGNAAFTKKITLMAAEESLVAIQKNLFKAKREELDLQESLTASQNALNDATDEYAKSANSLVAGERESAVNQNLEQQKKLQAEYQKSMEAAKKLGVDINAVAEKTKPLPFTNPEEVEKRTKEVAEKLKQFAEQIKGFQADVSQTEAEGYEKDILKVREKYQKQFDALKEFRAKFPEASAKAFAIERQMVDLESQNIVQIVKNQLKEIDEAIAEHDQEAANRLLSKEQTEEAAIRKRYEKQILTVTKLENDTVNATDAQRQRAHQQRIALEANRELEVANMKNRLRSEQEAKDAEATNQFWAEMRRLKDEFDAAMAAKPAKVTDGTVDEEIINIRERADIEIAEIKRKYDALIEQEKGYDDRVLALRQKQTDLVTGVERKASADQSKVKTAFIAAQLKAETDLKLAKIGAAQDALGALMQFATKGSAVYKAMFLFQKLLAAADVVIRFQQERAAIAATNAALGPAGIPLTLVQTNLARFRMFGSLATIAATSIGEFVAPQKFDGGYTNVRGAADGKMYNSKYIGQQNTGMLNYNSPVLMNTSQGATLANEKGQEFFVSNAALRNPAVFKYTQIIDDIVNRRAPADSGSPSVQGGGGNDAAVIAAIDRNTQVLQQLMGVLNGGVVATFSDDFQFVAELQKRQNRLLAIDPNLKTRTY